MKIKNNKKEINIEKKNKIKPISINETIYENEVSYTEDKEPRLRKLVKKKNKKNGISSSDEEEWDII